MINSPKKRIRDDIAEEDPFLGQVTEETPPKEFSANYPAPILACILYLVVGPTLILLNKWIMKQQSFKYPMTLSSMGLLSSTIISRGMVMSGKFQKTKEFDWKMWTKSILPIGVTLALTLNFGNRVYLYLSVSLIQMLKAFTPVMTLIIAVFFKLTKFDYKLGAAVLLLSLGTCISSTTTNTPEYSLYGFICMFLAEFFEAMRLILTQILLTNFKVHPLEGLYWNAPVSLVAMMVMIFFVEFEGLQEEGFRIMQENWITFIFAGLLGFCVNLLGYYVVQLTSAVTLKILGSIRNIGLIVVSCMFFGDVVNFQQSIGYAITLGGFAWYNYIKMNAKS